MQKWLKFERAVTRQKVLNNILISKKILIQTHSEIFQGRILRSEKGSYIEEPLKISSKLIRDAKINYLRPRGCIQQKFASQYFITTLHTGLLSNCDLMLIIQEISSHRLSFYPLFSPYTDYTMAVVMVTIIFIMQSESTMGSRRRCELLPVISVS